MKTMATLVDVWSRMFAQGMERETARGVDSSTRLRAFAGEDILFYVKRHDNRSVVRAADPAARGRCWKLIGSVVGAAVLLIGVLLPNAYGLIAGFQIQSLRQEERKLATDQASLELREAQLLSPARIQELARQQEFVEPAPARVMYLDGAQNALAMNGK
jgi:hypothetical protein